MVECATLQVARNVMREIHQLLSLVLEIGAMYKLVLCRFPKIRNCELQALLPSERGIDVRGFDSFDGIDSR